MQSHGTSLSTQSTNDFLVQCVLDTLQHIHVYLSCMYVHVSFVHMYICILAVLWIRFSIYIDHEFGRPRRASTMLSNGWGRYSNIMSRSLALARPRETQKFQIFPKNGAFSSEKCGKSWMGRLRNGKNEDLEIEYGISWGVWTYTQQKKDIWVWLNILVINTQSMAQIKQGQLWLTKPAEGWWGTQASVRKWCECGPGSEINEYVKY